MIIDCISDLHGHYPQLEGGDLLIVAGDLFKNDDPKENIYLLGWLETQEYKTIIIVAGNHDNLLKSGYPSNKKTAYLCDSGTEFGGLKIWGSPWTKRFSGENPRCLAFSCETEEELAEHWKCIPEDTDILVTHSPPYGILDEVDEVTKWGTKQFNVGSSSLLDRCFRIPYKLHVFGHIHEGYGMIDGRHDPRGGHSILVNASHVNERYEPVNKPVRIEL